MGRNWRQRTKQKNYTKNDRLQYEDLHAFLCSSDISGCHADFHEGHGMTGARHGMCELTHELAWERHGRGMLCVNPPLSSWSPMGL
jgi:hypothetical protein